MSSDSDISNNMLGSDEDEEDNDTLQRPVLFVPPIGKDEDLSAPPMDGFEFLKRVKEETKRCDGLVVKSVETKPQKNLHKQVPNFPEVTSCPEFYMDKETQLNCLAEFSKLRLHYEARRAKIPQDQINKMRSSLPSTNDERDWLKIVSKTPTNLADTLGLHYSSIELFLAMSQPTISIIIENLHDWLTDGELSVPVACHWFYTLLACLETPLDPNLHSSVRQSARALISHRCQLESIASEELPHINIVICIIGRYFNQLDLADPLV